MVQGGGVKMPTTRTKTKATDPANQAVTAAKPICRRLFSTHQAADFAGVPVQRIYRWIKTGKLEAYVLRGRIRIDEVELADCISFLAPEQP
jgi:excisionase family DNA binding protein